MPAAVANADTSRLTERRRSIGIAPAAATRDPWNIAVRSNPMRGVGASKYDTVSEGSPGVPTTWDMVLKGDSMRHKTAREQFNALDRNGDGFIDANEVSEMLRGRGGSGSDATSSLMSAAGVNGRGKIDYDSFIRMLRNSVVPTAIPTTTQASSSTSSTPASTPPTRTSMLQRWSVSDGELGSFIDFN